MFCSLQCVRSTALQSGELELYDKISDAQPEGQGHSISVRDRFGQCNVFAVRISFQSNVPLASFQFWQHPNPLIPSISLCLKIIKLCVMVQCFNHANNVFDSCSNIILHLQSSTHKNEPIINAYKSFIDIFSVP